VTDKRVQKYAEILVDHSARITEGDRVLIQGTTAALPLIEALYALILERGGHPYTELKFPDQDRVFFEKANKDQLAQTPILRQLAYDQFESRYNIHSLTDLDAMRDVDPDKQRVHNQATASILESQMRRGAAKEFKWVTTLFPTQAYADQAGMSFSDYEDFVFSAAHADDKDPIAYWNKVKTSQAKIIEKIQGHNEVVLRGPNVDLKLSIKGRTFVNACGEHNLPDGEIYTGPVENSVNGWVKYTYPSVSSGRVVEGVELRFVDGKVFHAAAKKNQPFLLQMLETDPGARYVGEFAIGTNFEINRFTGNILFDEKLGGSFHMALGAGYPETGSQNKSQIHWDMICDMREDSEILVDGDVIYKNGQFTI
jgi:aminopeptidase